MPKTLATTRHQSQERAAGKALVSRLKKLMTKKGWLQDETAQKIPISWITMNRYMNGHRVPLGLYASAVETFLNKEGG